MHIQGDLYVEKFLLDEKQLQSLVFENPKRRIAEIQGLPTKGIVPYYKLYRLVKKRNKMYWRLPRYFFLHLVKGKTIHVHDMSKPIDIKLSKPKSFKYSDEQVDTMNKTLKYLREDKGAFIYAKPGEGKTSMAIGLICKLKQKTLILVQKDVMIKQWHDALLQLTNLKPNEIGLLKRGKFIDGKVVIGSQHSLMNSTFGKEINDLFGFKIQDEAHKTPAPMFLKSNVRFRTEYHLGLSATPKREDGLEEMYYYYVSKNIVAHKNSRSMQSNYRVYKYLTKKEWIEPHYVIPYKTQLINNIVADDRRISFIMEILRRHKSRKIVILGERIPHLKAIMDIAMHEFPDKNIMRFFGAETEKKRYQQVVWNFKSKGQYKVKLSDGTKTTLVITNLTRDKSVMNYVLEGQGQYFVNAEAVLNTKHHPLKRYVEKKWKNRITKLEDVVDPSLEELKTADWIFATQRKMADAVDIPNLNTILYATPFGSGTLLEQSKGRVERFVVDKNKPLVLDIIDVKYSGAWKYWTARETLYLGLNMKKLKIKNKIKI